MKIVCSLLLIFQLQIGFSQSQTVSTDPFIVQKTRGYIRSYLDNGLLLAAHPLHWKGKDLAVVGGTLAITAGLTLIDEDINNPFRRWHNKHTSFGTVGEVAGSVPIMMGTGVVIMGIAASIKNTKLLNFALDNLQAQIFSGAGAFVIKGFFGRARPFQELGAHYWDGPFKDNRYSSFYSGHSTLAYSTATMVFLHSHRNVWVGLGSYGIASAICISRLQNQKHWTSDVFLGAVTGWAVSSFVYHQNERKRTAKKLKGIF